MEKTQNTGKKVFTGVVVSDKMDKTVCCKNYNKEAAPSVQKVRDKLGKV